jgi:hypothetical protein
MIKTNLSFKESGEYFSLELAKASALSEIKILLSQVPVYEPLQEESKENQAIISYEEICKLMKMPK